MHPLDGARAKVERAQEHLDTLDAETTAFGHGKTYRIVHKYYAKTCHLTFRIVPDANPPDLRWAVIIGDIVHELSSALDHIAWQLALKTRPNPSRATGWPVCIRDGEWESKRTKDMLKHISPTDRTFIKSKQPYPAPHGLEPRTHPFAMLRLLSRIDKHQVLHAAVVLAHERDIQFVEIRDIADVREVIVYDEPVKHGTKLLRAFVEPSGPKPDMDVKAMLSLYIAFTGSEYGHMDKGAVFLVCRAIIRAVSELIEQADARLPATHGRVASPSKG